MADLRVTFTLRATDLKHLRGVMRRAIKAAEGRSEEEILQAALSNARRVREARAPGYVISRIELLEDLVAMVRDKDWVLPGSVRPRVLTALAYFLDPLDLIPDHVPGLGFLDDAIMIELMAQELRHEVEGYQDFRRFRDKEQSRRSTQPIEIRLNSKRKALRARIQHRRAKDKDRAQSGRRFRLW
jgi:uncharacterized membrane protein YkvA (DUF1232 family)